MTTDSRCAVSVLIPTYRRQEALMRCISGIARQCCHPDEVIVIVRTDDDATAAALDQVGDLPFTLRVVAVEEAGVVAAMQAGLDTVQSEITAIIDDDAVARPDWLLQMCATFDTHPDIAGVGGRDILYKDGGPVPGQARIVGRVTWWGKHIGNHHLGVGSARDVDVLKGANCAYRTDVLRSVGFDRRLHGEGAQVHWELSLGLTLRRAGWRLIYDPAILVDHYPAPRYDRDQRDVFNFTARVDEAHNETLALLDYLGPVQRVVFLGWAVMVGCRATPGFGQWLRFLLFEGRSIHVHLWATLIGRWYGFRTWAKTRHARLGTAVPRVRAVRPR